MKFRPLCQPLVSPDKRIAAERERNRRAIESVTYDPSKMRITNANASTIEPWVLFKEIARADGLYFLQHPSLIQGNRVWRKTA